MIGLLLGPNDLNGCLVKSALSAGIITGKDVAGLIGDEHIAADGQTGRLDQFITQLLVQDPSCEDMMIITLAFHRSRLLKKSVA